jgi:GT2 family glycosyltransferase
MPDIPTDIHIAIVHFDTEPPIFEATLRSVAEAVRQAASCGIQAAVTVVWNDDAPWPNEKIKASLGSTAFQSIAGHGNIGYGRGNNRALLASGAEHVLVLNPDVCLDRAALVEAHTYLKNNPGCVGITPNTVEANGTRAFLAKREPSIGLLLLRGFAPRMLRKPFAAALDHYECRDEDYSQPFKVPIASGAFMYLRHAAFRALNGFDERYFLYFEDFDLSHRLQKIGAIHYVPTVKMTHFGGKAARKGMGHIGMFIRSGVRYFWNR